MASSSSRPAKSRASGRVLDAIRSLSRATQLVMYIPANLAPRAHLQRLSALLTDGGVQELRPYTELFKLFGGLGGRIWDVGPLHPTTSPPPPDGGWEGDGEGDRGIPPPYHEACAAPSALPTSKSRKPLLCYSLDQLFLYTFLFFTLFYLSFLVLSQPIMCSRMSMARA
jgi:hypothetical protein